MSEQQLPMAGNGGGAPPPPPAAPPTSSARLVGTLAVAGALAGLAIVLVFQWANPRIEAYKAKVLAEAVTEVLGGPDHYATLFVENGALTETPQADTTGLDRVYVGFDANGVPRGVALEAEEAGFQDIITLIFGYDPDSGDLLGMKVLDNKETPGLGDKIVKDTVFVRGFENVGTPLLGVKKGQGSGGHDEVVMITGATISSRAVIGIINHRLEALKGPVDTYWSGLVSSAAEQGTSATASADTGERSGGR